MEVQFKAGITRHCFLVLLALIFASDMGRGFGQSTLALKRVGTTPTPIMMHGSAVIKDRMYVIGGNADTLGWSNSVWSAKINADSSISDWRSEPPLPDYRSYIMNSVQTVGNRIYVIGGTNRAGAASPDGQSTTAQDILWAEAGADGTLSQWQRSMPYPGDKVTNAASFASGNAVYLVGGRGGGISSAVTIAELAADGSIKGWKMSKPMPVSTWFQGAGTLGNHAFVWGGLVKTDNQFCNDQIYRADIQADGSLGEWASVGRIATSVYSAGFTAMNGFLVSVAGRYQMGYPTNGMWYAAVKGGVPGEWAFLNTDLQTRLYMALAVDRAGGRIFVVGGRDRTARTVEEDVNSHVLDTIQAFQLTPAK